MPPLHAAPPAAPRGTAEKKPQPGFGAWTRRTLRALGPGVVTGAADDDPSGVATYSIAGAQFGTKLLWTVILTWPLMYAAQMMCARIGMVTGEGLAAVWKRKLPTGWLLAISLLLLAANTINIAADLAGMADAAQMLTGLNSHLGVVFFSVAVTAATVLASYRRISTVLKWLVLALFAYVITGFVARPDWRDVARATVLPSWPKSRDEWATIVAIFGTTISPYLFFWQAAQEVEEKNIPGPGRARPGASPHALANRRLDVGVGTFFSNVVMFFIILSCAATLHQRGVTHIESAKQAAEALRPAVGPAATALYTLGLVAVGCLAIPTLAGSSAYALADTLKWRQGLDERYRRAPAFYGVIILSGILGIALNFLGLNPIRALYWSAVINGVLAPFLLVGILLVAVDSKIMRGQTSSSASRIAVGVTILVMFATSAALLFV